jgi:predicted DNA-binding protein
MIRTQVQLTAEQAERLRRLSAETGKSIAALIREAVDGYAGDPKVEAQWQRALASVGRFRSGETDISDEHDRYLAEAYADR